MSAVVVIPEGGVSPLPPQAISAKPSVQYPRNVANFLTCRTLLVLTKSNPDAMILSFRLSQPSIEGAFSQCYSPKRNKFFSRCGGLTFLLPGSSSRTHV